MSSEQHIPLSTGEDWLQFFLGLTLALCVVVGILGLEIIPIPWGDLIFSKGLTRGEGYGAGLAIILVIYLSSNWKSL